MRYTSPSSFRLLRPLRLFPCALFRLGRLVCVLFRLMLGVSLGVFCRFRSNVRRYCLVCIPPSVFFGVYLLLRVTVDLPSLFCLRWQSSFHSSSESYMLSSLSLLPFTVLFFSRRLPLSLFLCVLSVRYSSPYALRFRFAASSSMCFFALFSS